MAASTYHICRPQTLQGAIIPISWDETHQAKSFELFTDQGEEVVIEPQSMPKVRRYLHSLVTITGTVCEGLDGQELIHVEHVENAPITAFWRP